MKGKMKMKKYQINNVGDINQLLHNIGWENHYIVQYDGLFALYKKECTGCTHKGKKIHKLIALSKSMRKMIQYLLSPIDQDEDIFNKELTIKQFKIAPDLESELGSTLLDIVHDDSSFNLWCNDIGVAQAIKLGSFYPLFITLLIGDREHILFDCDIYLVTDEPESMPNRQYSIISDNYEIDAYGECLIQAFSKCEPLIETPVFLNNRAWLYVNREMEILWKVREEDIHKLKKEIRTYKQEMKGMKKQIETLRNQVEKI